MAKKAPSRESRHEASRRKEEYWRDIFKQQEASGISHSEFCRKNSLSPNSYFWWKRELKTRATRRPSVKGASAPRRTKKQRVTSLVPVKVLKQPVAANGPGETFELVLTGGRIVKVPAQFDPESLKRLLSILEESC